jgi:LuxR family maltose regulon positive regulatory protein
VNPAIRQSLDKLGAFRLPDLAEYLGDNVLALQTPEIQAFLIRTSLLTRLCAPLCNVVMGRQGSQDVLVFLERAGLFVRSLDPEMRWFKYHTLFSSFLQEQLRKTCQSASFIEVHRLAADWYRKQGLFEEAMHHFIAANEYGLAAEILDSWSSLITDAPHDG